MVDAETFSIAIKNIRQQGLRSYLTLLGIVIGIAAIVALVAIGQGLNVSIENEFEKIGLNAIFVEPGGGSMLTMVYSRTVRESDIDIIERIPGVDSVAPFYETAATMHKGNETASAFLIGFDPDNTEYLEKSGFLELGRGRHLTKQDRFSLVVPQEFLDNAFDEPIDLRHEVEIEGKNFKIVGVTKPSSAMMSGFGVVNMVWLNAETMKDFFGEEDPIELAVIVANRKDVDEIAEEIERELRKDHGEKDFMIMTSENMLESASMVIGIVQIFLIGIASISLLVGGIGIMNTMLMAVIERTREIGVMKAIGATRRRILSLFLIESGLIGLAGGAVGILLGALFAFGVGAAASAFGFDLVPYFGIELIAAALGFSMAIGMISGFYPARRAADLDPVEALHYE